MTRTAITEKLQLVVNQQLGISEDEITADAKFMEDLGADSLDVVEIAMGAEEEFNIEIDDDIADTMTTFGALVDHVEAVLAKKRVPA